MGEHGDHVSRREAQEDLKGSAMGEKAALHAPPFGMRSHHPSAEPVANTA